MVALGAHSILFTERRVLHVRAGTWEQNWMAPWRRLKGVELQPARSRVLLQLFAEPFAPSRRVIECGNPETMQLVYRKLQGVRVEYAEHVTAQALAKLNAETGAATRPALPHVDD